MLGELPTLAVPEDLKMEAEAKVCGPVQHS